MTESSHGIGKGLTSVAEARARLVEAVAPVAVTETVALDAALGRVLAGAVSARVDVPPADNSAMDGYAVNTADLERAGDALPISARIQAGDAPGSLTAGSAARIFTGAVIPDGADAVVMQEKAREVDGQVQVEELPPPGNNIRRAGEDLGAGEEILAAGRRLRPQDLGLLASTGIERVELRRRLTVSVLSTGDELVDPGRALAPGQIYNSNQPLINGLLAALSCQVVAVRHVADTPEATRQALEAAAAEADVIVSTGGVSVGEADYVKDAVEALGRLDLWKIAVKPGKPLAFGRVGDAVFVGLPGNPVSALVTFSLFGAPVIRKMQGRSDTMPEAVRVPAGFAAPAPKREEYLRVRLQQGRLERYPHQGSGVLSSAVWADGLARFAVGQAVAEGDPVDYLGFERLLY